MATNTYQEGVSGPANSANVDTYIYDGAPTFNYGTQTGIQIGGGAVRGLFEFDVSDIAAGSVITSAEIDVNISLSSSPSDGTFCRILKSDWLELEATWNVFKSGSNWTTAGAAGDGTDIKSSGTGNDAPVAYTASVGTGHKTFTGLGPMTQDALDSRTGKLRFRWKANNEGGSNYIFFDSSDHATAANRPKLTVVYTAGGGAVPLRFRRALLGVGRMLPFWLPTLRGLFAYAGGMRCITIRKDPGGRQTVRHTLPVLA